MRHFFGIPDEEFIRGDVPMTKCEIRKAVMNEARIEEDSIVLDVGAGTGSKMCIRDRVRVAFEFVCTVASTNSDC